MKSAAEIHRLPGGLFVWQAWSPECKVDLTSTGIVTDAGLLLIDPIPLTPDAMEELVSAAGPVRAVLLTSGNHARDSGTFRIARLGARVRPPGCNPGTWLHRGFSPAG